MQISASAGFISFRFEDKDWNHPKGGAQAVIRGVKARIGHHSKNPDGFDWDPKELVWIVSDTPKNRTILEELVVAHLQDPDQLEIPL